MALLRPDHVRTLHRVADKEDGPVQADEVVVAVGRVELGREAARVPARVRELAPERHRTEPGEDRGPLPDLAQERRLRPSCDVVRHLKVTECSRAAWMDHTLER